MGQHGTLFMPTIEYLPLCPRHLHIQHLSSNIYVYCIALVVHTRSTIRHRICSNSTLSVLEIFKVHKLQTHAYSYLISDTVELRLTELCINHYVTLSCVFGTYWGCPHCQMFPVIPRANLNILWIYNACQVRCSNFLLSDYVSYWFVAKNRSFKTQILPAVILTNHRTKNCKKMY